MLEFSHIYICIYMYNKESTAFIIDGNISANKQGGRILCMGIIVL